MCKMQKRQVYDIKNLENTTVPSLHDRGQPIYITIQSVIIWVPSLHDRGQPKIMKPAHSSSGFHPCMTGVNLLSTSWILSGESSLPA